MSQRSETSQTAPPRLDFRVPPEPSHLLRARDRIRDYLRQYCTDELLINDVVICVEEAAANAVRHSGSELDIELSLGFEDGRLLADVRDHGRGFDITSFDRDAVPDLQSDHGRGLFIIAKLMDSLELRLNGGLEVRMTRRAASCAEPLPFDSALGDALDNRGRRNPRTQAMLDEIDEGFVALDWEYRYVHVNEAMLRLIDKPRSEVIDKVIWELFPELEDSSAAKQYRAAMELGRPSVFERRAIVGDDWLEVRVYPTPAGISIYFREINERKRIEQALVSSRAEFAAALAAITDGFYTLNRDWRVTYLNDKAAELFPRGKDALGASFWELFPEAAGSDFETNKRAAMERGEFRSYESYYPPLDTWFEERDYPSTDGITVLFTDITDRKRAEAERDQLTEAKALLLEAATTAAAWTDLDRMLESLGDLLLRATDHSRILLQLWDEERREVEIAVSRGAAAAPKRRFAFDGISDGAKEVITTKKTLVIDYATTGIPSLQKKYVDEHAFLLMLVVPIVYRERLIGLVTLDQPGEARPFDAKEIELVEAIAAQAGVAVANAQLYAERRQVAERLEHVLANTTDGFFIFDRDWHYVYVNESGAKQSQRSREELIGEVFWDVFPDVVGTEIYENLIAAAADGKPRRYEVYYEPYDMWVEHRVFPQNDSTAVFVRDVSEQKRAERTLRESERRLRLAQEATGLGIQDYDVRSDIANWDARVRELWGVGPDEPLTYETFLSGVHPDDREATLAAVDVAMNPRSTGSHEASYRVVNRTDGRERWVHATWKVFFQGGQATRMVGTVEDVTERHRAEVENQRMLEELSVRQGFNAALGEIATAITSLLSSEEILDVVVPRTGEALGAESATMCSLEPQGWVPRHAWNVPEEVLDVPIPREQVAYANYSIETRTPVAIDDCETDARVDIELQRSWGVRSVLTVPLVVRGKVAGSLFFNYHSRQHTFSVPEIDFASRVADLVSGMLEGARLYRIQRRIAETLQENFIHELPKVAGLEIGVVSGRAFASDLVGGDFSDVFALDDTHVVVLIGDVAGKGVRAAGHTETVRAKARAFATIDFSPAYILGSINELQLRFDPGDPHVTAFCAVLDPHTGHLTYASAGHPAPVHLGAFTCRPLDVTFGLPLGLFERSYTNGHAMLAIDDYLVLYTDGVTEARHDGEMFGEQRLLETVGGLRGRSAQEVGEGVRDAVLAFADKLRDDLQLIVVRLARAPEVS